ncbi:hypothetical protein KR009_010000, partial [Drosophila setifemur]
KNKSQTLDHFLMVKYPGLLAEFKDSGSCIIRGVFKSEVSQEITKTCRQTKDKPLNQDKNWIDLKLYLPHHPSLNSFQLYVLEDLEYKIYNSDNLKVKDDWVLDDLLANLAKLLPAQEVIPPAPDLGTIYEDILALHKPDEYSLKANASCSIIRFSDFTDFEQHYLELGVPSMQLMKHSLPSSVPLREMLEKSAHSVKEALNLFRKVLEDLRPFYDNFMNIDELCHVLQPSPVTTKHNFRVFPLKDRVYLKVTIADPFACFASMELKIIGPTEEVSRLRHVLSDGLGNWDPELDLHKNLLRIFDLCFFPMPDWTDGDKKEEDEENDQELRCNICFSYRLDDGSVPLVSCDNARCVLKCHAACLEEWFQTLMEGKTFLDVSFGQCPYCKAVSGFEYKYIEKR